MVHTKNVQNILLQQCDLFQVTNFILEIILCDASFGKIRHKLPEFGVDVITSQTKASGRIGMVPKNVY